MSSPRHILTVLFAVMAFLATAFASEYGTAEEARAMLQKAIASLKNDEAKALAAFNNKESEFRDRDLYVFCGGPDGKLTAHPRARGKTLRGFKDSTGKAIGEEMYAVAKEGTISEVVYLYPRRRGEEPREKITLITKVRDQICGVGYYK